MFIKTNDQSRLTARTVCCLICCVFLGFLVSPLARATVSVRDFGAVGDGHTNDSEAFQKALEAAEGHLLISPGRYKVANVRIPDGTMVRGAGARSVIVVSGNTGAAFRVGSDCTVMDLKFSGERVSATTPGTPPGAVYSERTPQMPSHWNKRLSLIRLMFENLHGCAISLDHMRNFRVSDCQFLKVGTAISLDFTHNGLVSGNHIEDVKNHGIMFWGSWKNDPLEKVTDVIFANNRLKNIGRGAIWGMGGRRIVMAGNVVEGAEAIGLDLEWCDDSVIMGNTVTNCNDAGIALFAACANVTIVGNSVVIGDSSITGRADLSAANRYDGIWLAPPNPRYAFDEGHRLVAVTGNSIRVKGNQRRNGIVISDGSSGITYQGNAMQNADIVDRSGKSADSQPDGLTTTIAVLNLSQQWRFKPDPADHGGKGRWPATEFDDSSWAIVRSDQNTGWESQAFEGYTGYGWYRAELPKLPRHPQKFKYLYFGGVDEQAWVYINGQLVGEHTVQSTGKSINILWNEPFSIDVTKHLRTDGPNIVAVKVHNAAVMGGIWQPVKLVLSDTVAPPLARQQEAIHRSTWEPMSLQNRW